MAAGAKRRQKETLGGPSHRLVRSQMKQHRVPVRPMFVCLGADSISERTFRRRDATHANPAALPRGLKSTATIVTPLRGASGCRTVGGRTRPCRSIADLTFQISNEKRSERRDGDIASYPLGDDTARRRAMAIADLIFHEGKWVSDRLRRSRVNTDLRSAPAATPVNHEIPEVRERWRDASLTRSRDGRATQGRQRTIGYHGLDRPKTTAVSEAS
jgi:hypothetical protein